MKIIEFLQLKLRKKAKPTDEILIKKLNQDDILRVLITHFQEYEYGESLGYGELLGEIDKDLRFIGIFRNDDKLVEYDIEKIDRETEFNGDDYPSA